MDAIHSDENGKADINYDKCVSCGQCLVNCPFGAIADKSQIFQVIRAIQTGERVYAAVAPAFVGQFGPKVTPGKLRAAMKALGFADVFEVAIGADLCAVQEAEDFVKEVPEQLPFMATSCCPAWSMMAKKLFPEQAKCISMALTPMVLTARLIKQQNPDCKIVFVGPCAAKKLEASRKTIGLPAGRILASLLATYSCILTSDTSRVAYASPSPAYRTLSYQLLAQFHSFGS